MRINSVKIDDAEKYFDEEIRFDLEIKKDNKLIAGIQVKPSSYHFIRKNVKKMNKHRNSLVKFPIFYLYYNYESEEFVNIDKVISLIKNVIVKSKYPNKNTNTS